MVDTVYKILAAIAALLGLALLLDGCARVSVKPPPVCNMVAMDEASDLPPFYDDASSVSLDKALATSIAFWQGQEPARWITVCDQHYPAAKILDSLLAFRAVLHAAPPQELAADLARDFDIYQAQNSKGGGNILVTGYFQPVLAGSLVRQPPYVYPVYGLPDDLIHASRYDASGESKPVIGRLENGRLRPYWRRAEIDDGVLSTAPVLLYLRDPVDAFVLHVQGSGLVVLPDGTMRQLRYAGSNGWPYKSIGRLLVDEGRLSLSEVNMPAIRQYLHSHPDERRHILHYNDRYIFFSLRPFIAGQEPVGAMGQPLTPGRSVALDTNCFPLGGLCYLDTEVPRFAGEKVIGWQPMRRFILAQDSGAAIKGSGRLDMFFGHGAKARQTAGEMRQPGKLYFLIKRQISASHNQQ